MVLTAKDKTILRDIIQSELAHLRKDRWTIPLLGQIRFLGAERRTEEELASLLKKLK